MQYFFLSKMLINILSDMNQRTTDCRTFIVFDCIPFQLIIKKKTNVIKHKNGPYTDKMSFIIDLHLYTHFCLHI